MLVNGIWNSKLQYGMSAWGSVWGHNGKLLDLDQNSINMKKSDMKKLQILQNSTLRLILRRKYDTPTTTLLSESKVLSVNHMVAYNVLVQVFKIQLTGEPSYHHQRLFGRLRDAQNETRSITRQDPRI